MNNFLDKKCHKLDKQIDTLRMCYLHIIYFLLLLLLFWKGSRVVGMD